VSLWLGQEVQEVPRRLRLRRLTRPDPPLADDAVRLEPMSQADHAEFLPLVGDEAIEAFTRIPSDADAPWVARWIARYERGWDDGSCAGFTICDAADGATLGFAALVHLDLDAREGEIGYLVLPAARGRGVAGRSVSLLTRWGFDELGLERLELRIDVANGASERVAERAGYRREGVLRNLHVKEGRRADTGVWSRLSTD
jgi:RimJ/RimL family protein N-acetyltransferase